MKFSKLVFRADGRSGELHLHMDESSSDGEPIECDLLDLVKFPNLLPPSPAELHLGTDGSV